MKEKISSNIAALCFGVLVIVFAIGFYAFAVWTEPGAEPPLDNVDPPINVGPDPQIKQGPLQVDGFRNIGTTVLDGNVGIGTTTPESKLHVEGGDIRISTTGKGLIFSDGTEQNTASLPRMVEAFCGGSWRALGTKTTEGLDWVETTHARWTISEGNVLRNDLKYVHVSIVATPPWVETRRIRAGGGLEHDWCTHCAGGLVLSSYTEHTPPGTIPIYRVVGAGCTGTNPANTFASVIYSISCGHICTDLRW